MVANFLKIILKLTLLEFSQQTKEKRDSLGKEAFLLLPTGMSEIIMILKVLITKFA